MLWGKAWGFPKILKKELPYLSASHLWVFLQKNWSGSAGDARIPTAVAALCASAKAWSHLRARVEAHMETLGHVHTVGPYSSEKEGKPVTSNSVGGP